MRSHRCIKHEGVCNLLNVANIFPELAELDSFYCIHLHLTSSLYCVLYFQIVISYLRKLSFLMLVLLLSFMLLLCCGCYYYLCVYVLVLLLLLPLVILLVYLWSLSMCIYLCIWDCAFVLLCTHLIVVVVAVSLFVSLLCLLVLLKMLFYISCRFRFAANDWLLRPISNERPYLCHMFSSIERKRCESTLDWTNREEITCIAIPYGN